MENKTDNLLADSRSSPNVQPDTQTTKYARFKSGSDYAAKPACFQQGYKVNMPFECHFTQAPMSLICI